jgi:DnaJ-class molecular chaperone
MVCHGFFFLVLIWNLLPCMAGRNLYEVLGVPKGCSNSELKKAYRRQCLEHHPDKGGKEETFKDIQKAYEILSDKNKRQMYDQYGEEVATARTTAPSFEQQQPGQMPNFFSFSSSSTGNGGMFGNINLEELLQGGLGTGNRQQQQGGSTFNLSDLWRQMGQASPRQQKPMTQKCPCSLEELATGATKKLKVTLNGKSKVYTIVLQKGWKAGTKITFDARTGITFPPVTFVILEKKHAIFQRRGNDLVYCYNILPTNNDVTIDLVLPTGESWSKTLPKTSSFLRHGQSLTITDKGMPIKGGPQRGNLIIEFYQQHQQPHDSDKGPSSSESPKAKTKQQCS